MRDYDAEIKKLEEQIEALKKEKEENESVLGFKNGDTAYQVYSSGTVGEIELSNGWSWGNNVLQGEVFHTREEAEFEVERRNVVAELKYLSKLSGEDENEWNGKNKHYYLMYDVYTTLVECVYTCSGKPATICFPTEQACRKAIKKVGEERIKKYYLGVE